MHRRKAGEFWQVYSFIFILLKCLPEVSVTVVNQFPRKLHFSIVNTLFNKAHFSCTKSKMHTFHACISQQQFMHVSRTGCKTIRNDINLLVHQPDEKQSDLSLPPTTRKWDNLPNWKEKNIRERWGNNYNFIVRVLFVLLEQGFWMGTNSKD